jgi:hypothetical protein
MPSKVASVHAQLHRYGAVTASMMSASRVTRRAICLLSLLGVLPTASAEGRNSEPTAGASVVHPAWRSVTTGGLRLQSDDGRYQLWTSNTHRYQATLINDRTGSRRRVSRASCTPTLLRPSWLLFDCGWTQAYQPIAELYSPTRGTWTAVTPAPSIESMCPPGTGSTPHGIICEITPADVGTRWIEYYVLPLQPPITYEYQNIATGQVVDSGISAPDAGSLVTATTSIDLDSPSLTKPICSPLRNPSGPFDGQTVYQSRSFFGQFTIDTVSHAQGAVLYLRRCGSNLHKRILTLRSDDHAPITNAKIVAWQTRPGQLNAWLLPRLHRVRMTLPRRAKGTVGTASLGLILSPRRMYLQTPNRLWVARIPSR